METTMDPAIDVKVVRIRDIDRIQSLPPIWIDVAEDVETNMLDLQNLITELKPLRAARFGQAIFDE